MKALQQHAEGDVVAAREDGGRTCARAIHEGSDCGQTEVAMIFAEPDEGGIDRLTCLLQRAHKSVKPLPGAEQVLRSSDMRDAPVTRLDEEPGRLMGAPLVLDENASHVRIGDILVERDHVSPARDAPTNAAIVRPFGQHDQSIDVAGVQTIDICAFDVRIAVRARDQQRIAEGSRLVLSGRSKRREERVGNLRRRKADQSRASGTQPLGKPVRPIGETFASPFDLIRGCRRQNQGFVEVTRNRCGRYARCPGDITNSRLPRSYAGILSMRNRFSKPVSRPTAAGRRRVRNRDLALADDLSVAQAPGGKPIKRRLGLPVIENPKMRDEALHRRVESRIPPKVGRKSGLLDVRGFDQRLPQLLHPIERLDVRDPCP